MIDTPELALAETFYASGLPSPQQAEFAQALRIAGLDGPVAENQAGAGHSFWALFGPGRPDRGHLWR